MRIRLIVSLFVLFLPFMSRSQTLPAEGNVLNYRLIGFTVSESKGTHDYVLEIAKGNILSDEDFAKNITITKHAATNRIIGEVPAFGAQYTWRMKSAGAQSATLHHFSTGIAPAVDTSNTRLKIIDKATKFMGAHVMIDNNMAMYDMTGHAVWYLPAIEGKVMNGTDLKLTPQGTITFIGDECGYEIDYDGHILWKTPDDGKISGAKRESYHHQFTRLSNGHYMILGTQFLMCRLQPDNTLVVVRGKKEEDRATDSSLVKHAFGTLIEYDEKGNVVWFYNTVRYFEESDMVNYIQKNPKELVDMHPNSFYYDEKDKNIYICFKNTDRIIKIKYPSGDILGSYGQIFKKGIPPTDENVYCWPHGVKRAKNGDFWVYNNNTCNKGAFPVVQKMQEPKEKAGVPKMVWDYECVTKINIPTGFKSGGNVEELTDGSVFISMALPGNKLFVIDQQKKTLWSALNEKWNDGQKNFSFQPMYRAHFIESEKDMDNLVWYSAKHQK